MSTRYTQGKDGRFTGSQAGASRLPTAQHHLRLLPPLEDTVLDDDSEPPSGRIGHSGAGPMMTSFTKEIPENLQPGTVVKVSIDGRYTENVVVTEYVPDMDGNQDVDGWRGYLLDDPTVHLSGYDDQIRKRYGTVLLSDSADKPQVGARLTYISGGAAREIIVTRLVDDVDGTGAPGFDGFLVTSPDTQVWGYNEQIVSS